MGQTEFKLLGINFHIELDQMQQINFNEIKAPQALHNTPPLLGAPKVIL